MRCLPRSRADLCLCHPSFSPTAFGPSHHSPCPASYAANIHEILDVFIGLIALHIRAQRVHNVWENHLEQSPILEPMAKHKLEARLQSRTPSSHRSSVSVDLRNLLVLGGLTDLLIKSGLLRQFCLEKRWQSIRRAPAPLAPDVVEEVKPLAIRLLWRRCRTNVCALYKNAARPVDQTRAILSATGLSCDTEWLDARTSPK